MNHDQRVFKKKCIYGCDILVQERTSETKPYWKGAVRKRGSGELWNDVCLRGRACSEAGSRWLPGRGPLLPSPLTESQSQMPESNNFILKLLSSWKLHSAVFQFSSLWAARLREQKSQETLRMWFAPGDSNRCLRIHEKFLSWKLFFKSPEIVASSPATVLQSPF